MIHGIVLESRFIGDYEGWEIYAYAIADPEPDVPWQQVILTVTASREGYELGQAHKSNLAHGENPAGDDVDAFESLWHTNLMETAIIDARLTLASLIR